MISPMRFVVCNVGRVTYFSFAKYQKEEKREEIHNTEKEGEVKKIREEIFVYRLLKIKESNEEKKGRH